MDNQWREKLNQWRRHHRRAVVLLSGGIDSVTVLALITKAGLGVHALTFDYGQRHSREVDSARVVASSYGVIEHIIIKLDFSSIHGYALLNDGSIPKGRFPAEIRASRPATYVPARNSVFIAHGIGIAEARRASLVLFGANADDCGSYPDCRPQFVEAAQLLADWGTWAGDRGDSPRILVEAPLIGERKAGIVRLARKLGVNIGQTLSCYDPGPGSRPCGECDACILRKEALENVRDLPQGL